MALSFDKKRTQLIFFINLWAHIMVFCRAKDVNAIEFDIFKIRSSSLPPLPSVENSYVASLPCLKGLIPCRAYLRPSTVPPESCCSPLKKMVYSDFKCLCDMYKSPNILARLNVTRDDALAITKSCKAKIDISFCELSTTSNSPLPAELAPISMEGHFDSKDSQANGITYIARSGFVAGLLSLIILSL